MSRRHAASTVVAPGVPRHAPIPISTGTVHLTDDPDGATTVWVDNVPSSTMRADPAILDFEYMQHFAAAIAAWAPPERMLALHVGACVCTMARHLSHTYPGSRHIAVDIDATLPTLARDWWDLPRAPHLRIREQDGLEALATRHDDSLDLVLRDAFSDGVTPPHLADDEWWEQARRTVRPHGLVVANMGTTPGSRDRGADAQAARRHFGAVAALGEPAVLKGRRRGNIVLVAADEIDVDALKRYGASAPLPTAADPAWAS